MKVPERFRILTGLMASDESDGNNGAFLVVVQPFAQRLYVMASDGCGWEHVSVSRRDRDPTWLEMCAVKDLFWNEDECVVQYHPPRHAYVNNHRHCLHMWRPTEGALPLPPGMLVGIPALGEFPL